MTRGGASLQLGPVGQCHHNRDANLRGAIDRVNRGLRTAQECTRNRGREPRRYFTTFTSVPLPSVAEAFGRSRAGMAYRRGLCSTMPFAGTSTQVGSASA